MPSLIHFWIISSFLVFAQADIYSKKDLILNYFAKVKKVHDLVIVSCVTEHDRIESLQKEASLRYLSNRFIDISNKVEVHETLKSSCMMGIYLDCSCEQCDWFLTQVC